MPDIIKVTSKGQITLPVSIRESIGLDQDSYLVVDQVGDYVLMKKVEARLDEITSVLSKEAKKKKLTKRDLLKALGKAEEDAWV